MKTINRSDYFYNLPETKIAQFPLQVRDTSKLLVYHEGTITHDTFHQIFKHINSNDTLFFNNTKVMPARLSFEKDTGAHIEIFLLQPVYPSAMMSEAMAAVGQTSWLCAIGNLKRWKVGQILQTSYMFNNRKCFVQATLVDREKQLVALRWENNSCDFTTLIQSLGTIPLPPYINRKAEVSDITAYQTVYGKVSGAVAAPTAGLHFTESLMQTLHRHTVCIDELTLHVGAGTFRPIHTEQVMSHPMHSEQIVITKQNIEHLRSARWVIAIGTTSLRTLESVYWFGVKILLETDDTFFIPKLMPYQYPDDALPSLQDALLAVREWMQVRSQEKITGFTEIFIVPGYHFKVCNGLVTNFHQPGSTLILLVAAFVGKDWKKIYDVALAADYRFLSYGDASLLFR